MTAPRWQRARVLPGNPALPAGTELWVSGDPEPMPAEEAEVGDLRWRRPEGPADRLLRTHLTIGSGEPLYARLSLLELLADFRDDVAVVDLLTVPGVDLSFVRIGRDPP